MAWSGYRKAKQGPQQGTLFDVREVPSQPVDSPGMQKRGRRAEMLEAMPKTKVLPSESAHGEVAAKVRDREGYRGTGVHAGVTVSNPETWIANRATDHAGKGRRAEMARELADQTTVHPDTLRGLAQISEGQHVRGQQKNYPEFGPNTAAHYTSIANGPAIQAPYKMSVGTLTHEIGHHESRYHNRNTSTGVERPTLRRGGRPDLAEEGRADAFALQHAPKEYTYASNALGDGESELFTRPESPYRQEREAAGQPLREWEGGEPATNVGQQFQQLSAFETEPAFGREADAEVQAYTRDEGREVIGWSPYRYDDPTSVQKNEYDPEHQKPFWGANYVSMFNDDVIPERHLDDYDIAPKQTWRG